MKREREGEQKRVLGYRGEKKMEDIVRRKEQKKNGQKLVDADERNKERGHMVIEEERKVGNRCKEKELRGKGDEDGSIVKDGRM